MLVGDDYVAESFELSFTAGDTFDLTGCVMIQTNNDNFLEGDHDFIVLVNNISPNGAVVANENFTVTITDADDGGHLLCCQPLS